jgi:hypothetical protein
MAARFYTLGRRESAAIKGGLGQKTPKWVGLSARIEKRIFLNGGRLFESESASSP